MKRRHTYAIGAYLAATLIIGCKSEYPHIEYEGDLGEVTYENIEAPVPIIVAVNDPIYVSYTRGAGVFDDLDEEHNSNDKWWGADFYVYAFYTPNGLPGTPQSAADYKAKMGSDSEEMPPFCLIDDAQEGEKGHGKLARLDKNKESFLHWVNDDKIYYNKTHQQCRYKFFAYYLDDAATDPSTSLIKSPERTSDRVTYDIEIDGTQDLMCGYASPTEIQIENLTKAGEKDIVNNIDALAYSTTTGNRDLFPIFHMKHQLTYLKFYVKAGSTNGIIDPEASNVEIKNISIMTQTKGKFTVAAEDETNMKATFQGDAKELYMPIEDHEGKVITGTKEGFSPYVSPLADGKEIEVGMGFLLPESENYELKLYCRQLKYNTDGSPQLDEQGRPKEINYIVTYTLNLKDEAFKAGHKYEITIHVYGHQKIKLGLGEVTWSDGGKIEIDDEVSGDENNMEYDYN